MITRCTAVLVTLVAFATPALAGAPFALGPMITASAGGHATGGEFTLGYTLGEAVVGLSLAPAAPFAHSAGFWGSGNGPVLGIGEPDVELPSPRLSLSIAPNPFATSTEIRLVLPSEARAHAARIRLFDSSGRLIRELPLPRGVSGRSSVLWDGSDHSGRSMPVGIYHCRVEAGPFIEIRRIAHVH